MGTTVINNYQGPTNGMFQYGSIGSTSMPNCNGRGSHKSFGDITDGTSNTVAIGEKGHGDGGAVGGIAAARSLRIVIGLSVYPFTTAALAANPTICLATARGKFYISGTVGDATNSLIGKDGTRPATAVSTADGSYELYTLDSPGALPGIYHVVVTKMDALPESANQDLGRSPTGEDLSMEQAATNIRKPMPTPKELVPSKNANPATTPLNFEVKNAGKNVIDLKLE